MTKKVDMNNFIDDYSRVILVKSSLDCCIAFWGNSIPESSFRGEKDFLPESKLLNFIIQELRSTIVLIFANMWRTFSYKASARQRERTEQLGQCYLEPGPSLLKNFGGDKPSPYSLNRSTNLFCKIDQIGGTLRNWYLAMPIVMV